MKKIEGGGQKIILFRTKGTIISRIFCARARSRSWCMVALVAESAFVFGAKYIMPQSKLFGIIEVNALVDETNQNRVANGLPDLQVSPLLQAAAQEKANDEATKGYFAHTSPQGLTPWYWFQQVGYNFDYAGENLAVNFSDSQDVTNAWMNSPEHRANILSTDFTQIGIATAQGIYDGEPTTFVVEEFGTPAPAAAPVAFVDTASAATAPVASAPVVTRRRDAVATKPRPRTEKNRSLKPRVATTVPVVVAMQSSSAPRDAADVHCGAGRGNANRSGCAGEPPPRHPSAPRPRPRRSRRRAISFSRSSPIRKRWRMIFIFS